MGHVGSKTMSLGQILEKPCVRSRDHIFSLIIIKIGQIFVLMKSRIDIKMGHVRSKTGSPGQILEKPCVCSRDQIFGLLLMKLGQRFCLDEILYIFENGSRWVEK